MLRRIIITALAVGLLLVYIPPVFALTGPVTCPPGQAPDPRSGVCKVVITTPGGGAGGGSPGADPSPTGGATPVPAPKCVSIRNGEVPCRVGDAWWNNDLDCYVSLQQPQPPKSSPIWQGHTDGAIYNCSDPGNGGTGGTTFWSATRPGGPAAPPDPRDLAQQAIAVMRLRAINIGIVPEPRPGSVGIIGFPTWMWAQAPDQSTWGPVTRSVSAGGFTVTATAKVDRVVWSMGDGVMVVCTEPGTPYADSFGKAPSPDCGHTYIRTGRYTVRATSHWVVTWAGIGQSGTIPLDFTDTTAVTMGEVQVLSQ
jgi:hypothetical protein